MAIFSTSQKINLAGHKVPVLYVVGGLLMAGVGGYFLLKKPKPTMATAPLVPVAPDVQFTTNPQKIQPPMPFTIIGQFQTMQGQPVTVRQGYYYVFILDASRQKRLVSQGTVGMMVSHFAIPVNTQGWQSGNYSVVVTDVMMTPQEMSQQGIMTGQPPQVAGGQFDLGTAPVMPLPSPSPAQQPPPASGQPSGPAPFNPAVYG
jgi:hypothetical protein